MTKRQHKQRAEQKSRKFRELRQKLQDKQAAKRFKYENDADLHHATLTTALESLQAQKQAGLEIWGRQQGPPRDPKRPVAGAIESGVKPYTEAEQKEIFSEMMEEGLADSSGVLGGEKRYILDDPVLNPKPAVKAAGVFQAVSPNVVDGDNKLMHHEAGKAPVGPRDLTPYAFVKR